MKLRDVWINHRSSWKIGHSDLVLCMSLDLVQVHTCFKYEGSMTNQMGIIVDTGKSKNGCRFKNIGHVDYMCIY